MALKSSRQSRRIDRLTKDPNGPQLRRVDVLVSPYHWALFETIRNHGNLKQRCAIEKALEAQYLSMLVDGTISSDVVPKNRLLA